MAEVTLLIHPYCGCGLAQVRGWWIEGHGVIECLMCRATWTEILPWEAEWRVLYWSPPAKAPKEKKTK